MVSVTWGKIRVQDALFGMALRNMHRDGVVGGGEDPSWHTMAEYDHLLCVWHGDQLWRVPRVSIESIELLAMTIC
jgi:hypothetical protein